MVDSRGHRARHPLLIGMFVGMNPHPATPHLPLASSMPGGLGQGGGEMSGAKCKFMLTSGAENMFSTTLGTLIFRKVK